jgi:hypothetical protein
MAPVSFLLLVRWPGEPIVLQVNAGICRFLYPGAHNYRLVYRLVCAYSLSPGLYKGSAARPVYDASLLFVLLCLIFSSVV